MSPKKLCFMIAISSLVIAASASAQSGMAGAAANGKGSSRATTEQGTLTAEANAAAQAHADADVQTRMKAIEEKGAKVSSKARERAEAKLQTATNKVNETAEKHGDAKMAERLAKEFGTTADVMMDEKAQVSGTWGDLMVAHTLAANAKPGLSATQLCRMNHSGSGWGQIAAGLGLKLNDVVTSVAAESRVATGLAKADGKVAAIHGEGARAGVGVNAGVATGVGAGHTHVGTEVGGTVKLGH